MPRNIGMKTDMARRFDGRAEHRNKNRLSGFALMELILAVAIMGILLVSTLKYGQKLFDFCYKFIDKISLATLVAEYNAVAWHMDLSGITDMKDFAVTLAKAGGPNDIASYQSIKRRDKKHMDIVVGGQQNAALSNVDFDFIAVKPNNKPTARNILFCTRGIDVGGRWSSPDSLYGNEGGIIAFRDGHTEWVSECPRAPSYLAKWYD